MATQTQPPSPAVTDEKPYSWKRVLGGIALLVLVYCAVVYLIPRPAAVKPEGWRLTGLFIATVVGLMIEPIPGAAVVLLGVVLAAPLGKLTMDQALAGYSNGTTWLVLAAFFLSRALIKTGLARRIALFFVRMFGKSSLGVSYALTVSDCVLGAMIPSNGARVGGVILPIARSIAELFDSSPGPTAALLGTFLMTAVYQSAVLSSAMFYTGQVSNSLAARMAVGYGYRITWFSWLEATIVPGAVAVLVMPWLMLKLTRPKVLRTPEAAAFARGELAAMGPMKSSERIVAVVLTGVCGMWVASSWTNFDITLTALLGGLVLLLAGVITWEDLKSDRNAWSLFIWYGGLVRLGGLLNDSGAPKAFAEGIANQFKGVSVLALFVISMLIYFYAHYFFASITSHVLSMFPAFVPVLLAAGAPLGLTVFAFAIFANLAAGVTHFGTTPGPMIFAHGYVGLGSWWRTGFLMSLVNLAIWSTVGVAWWKFIGVW